GGDLLHRPQRCRGRSLGLRGGAREALLPAVTETRQTFANLAHWEIVFWYGLIGVSTAIFAWGLLRLALRYRQARGGIRVPDRPVQRVWRTSLIVLTHAWIKRRDGIAGLAHAAVFYGLLVLFA